VFLVAHLGSDRIDLDAVDCLIGGLGQLTQSRALDESVSHDKNTSGFQHRPKGRETALYDTPAERAGHNADAIEYQQRPANQGHQ
jgi:hypothetical protein